LKTVKGAWTFEVPEEKQAAYLKATAERIKPYWESHGCLSYQVHQDWIDPRRFVKEQYYPDRETMERDGALLFEQEDFEVLAMVDLFNSFAENVNRLLCEIRVGEGETVIRGR
jgi:hypothetical protein